MSKSTVKSIAAKVMCGTLLCVGTLAAQSAGSLITESKQGYAAVKANILKAAEKMPEEGYDFKPTPEIRSFGALVGHIADAQMRTCSTVRGETKPATAGKMTAKAELVAALKASIDECDAAYESITAESAYTTIKLRNTERTKLGAMIYNTGHSNEEYGYMAVYLRLKGVVPPSSEK